MDGLRYGPLPSYEETREGGVILECCLIIIQMFTNAMLDFFLRSSIVDAESQGYLPELCFLFRLEGARVHGCCHRGEGQRWWFGEYELNQHQQIA